MDVVYDTLDRNLFKVSGLAFQFFTARQITCPFLSPYLSVSVSLLSEMIFTPA